MIQHSPRLGRLNVTKGRSCGFFLWARDWLTSESVLAMPRDARSLYLDLLAHQSLSGSIPADTRVLARLCGEGHADFMRMWEGDGVSLQFHPAANEPGRLQNRRMAEEQAADDEYKRRKAAAGAAGGQQTSSRRVAREAANGVANEQPPKSSSSSKSSSFAPPESVCVDARADEGPCFRLKFLGMHPTLDTPEVRVALENWEAHLREAGRRPLTPRAWETNLVQWERWGPARLVSNIATTIKANSFTVFEPTFRPGPANPKPSEPECDPMIRGGSRLSLMDVPTSKHPRGIREVLQ